MEEIRCRLQKKGKMPAKTSWAFKSMVKCSRTMLPGCGRRVGSGQQSSVLEEVWAGKALVKFKNTISLDQREKPKVVKDLMRGRAWDATKVWQWFDKRDSLSILSTYIPQQEKEDETIWIHKRNRGYSVKKGYWFLQNSTKQESQTTAFWKIFWKSKMSQRWKNFLKRGIEVEPTCVFCGERETTDHLFLNCEITWRIWSSSVLGLRNPSYPAQVSLCGSKIMFTYLQRTSAEKEKLNPRTILYLADAEIEQWYKGFRDNKEREQTGVHNFINQWETTSWKWGTNTQGDNILKIDGAWKEIEIGEFRAAYGWVLEQGSRCIQQRASKVFAASSLQAEAHALVDGSLKARNDWLQIEIWTDSIELIQLLHKPENAPSSCYFLIIDILNVLKSFSACRVYKVNRSCIRKAHVLATQARKEA
ncbi:hypothetical protein RDABS01_014538 [Bienertia sinuspersici]